VCFSPVVTNLEQKLAVILLRTDFWDDLFLQNATPSLAHKRECATALESPAKIPVTLVNLDLLHPFSESCQILLINPKACAARSTRAFEIGPAVELQGAPTRTVIAKIVKSVIGERP
jgi:hypothetical protein